HVLVHPRCAPVPPRRASTFFFFTHTATTELFTLSLHDALPISAPAATPRKGGRPSPPAPPAGCARQTRARPRRTTGRSGAPAPADRKSTRLNSSHLGISYAVFCLKKKKNGREWYGKRRIYLAFR